MDRRKFLRGMAGTGLAVLPLLRSRLYASLPAGSDRDSEKGIPLTPWKEGDLEIHSIYTGYAESTFCIFPDGTSMLVDSGFMNRDHCTYKSVSLPDESREPGEWIARYIERVNPFKTEVDYMMISHFHSDHLGGIKKNSGSTAGRGNDYVLSGMTRTGETIHFKKGFDRGFPDYQFPFPITDPDVENYRKFLKWKMKEDQLEMIPFEAGALDQISLRKNPSSFDSFHIRNLFKNGILWTGNEGELNTEPADCFIREGEAGENKLSLGIRIEYGPFRYYTGGDFNGGYTDSSGTKKNLEAEIAPVCGRVNVCKANHHSFTGTMHPDFMRAVQPQVIVINVWNEHHIQPSTMENMTSRTLYPDDRIVCPTNFPPPMQKQYEGAAWRSSVAEEGGHVVIRVTDKGQSFKVYYVTAGDESGIVKSVYGPFSSER